MTPSHIPNESIRRRYGQVRISKLIIDQVVDRTGSNAQAAWNAIMCDFVILHVEECRMSGSIRYAGYHPQFDLLPADAEFCTTSEYDCEVHPRVEAHNITTFEVKFVRR